MQSTKKKEVSIATPFEGDKPLELLEQLIYDRWKYLSCPAFASSVKDKAPYGQMASERVASDVSTFRVTSFHAFVKCSLPWTQDEVDMKKNSWVCLNFSSQGRDKFNKHQISTALG